MYLSASSRNESISLQLRTNPLQEAPWQPPSGPVNVLSSWTDGPWDALRVDDCLRPTQSSAFLQGWIIRISKHRWFCDLNTCPWGIGLRWLTHYTHLSHSRSFTPDHSIKQFWAVAGHVCINKCHVREQNHNSGALWVRHREGFIHWQGQCNNLLEIVQR